VAFILHVIFSRKHDHYYRAGTGGSGWEDLHAKRAIDGQKRPVNISIWRGPFPAEEEKPELDKFQTRKLKRKNVLITASR
jgi:hypothetical protein